MPLVAAFRYLMQPSSNPDIPARYLEALSIVLEEVATFTKPVGIILTGSVVHGNPTPTSDLDVAILHDATWRQRIQRIVDDTPVEVFINSNAWWRRTFSSEAAAGLAPAAHFLAHGVIYLDANGRMLDLQHFAQKVVDNGPQPSENLIDTSRYFAVTTLEDGGDILTVDPDRARWLLFDAIDRAIRYHYLVNRNWIPRHKDVFLDLDVRWPEMGAFVRRAYNAKSIVAIYDIATAIVESCTGATRFFNWSSSRQEPEPS